MKANLLQMRTGRTTAENFLRTVETIERSVNFTIQVIASEDGSNRLCQVELPNQENGVTGRLCVALLSPENVGQLIGALSAFLALP
jgi:hypothetical protein